MPNEKNLAQKPIKLPKKNNNVIPISWKDKAEAKKWVAELCLSPEWNAAELALAFNPNGSLDLAEVMGKLKEHARAANDGDLSHVEAMLLDQAHALQAVFVNLAARVPNQEYLKNFEAYMRMALKAQNQCRMTLETLATIKNPPVVFARQANIAQGPQQVNNNGMAPAAEPRAGGKNENTPNELNELLEEKPHERLDFGTPGAAVGVNTHLAAVEEGDRTEDAGR